MQNTAETLVMARPYVSAENLRNSRIPEVKGGFKRDETLALVALAAETIKSLEDQVIELQRAVATARAEAVPMDVGVSTVGHETEDAISKWLANLDPVKVDQEVQQTIADSIVESTLAARQIRSEAQKRISVLVDEIARSVRQLFEDVNLAKSTVQGVAQIPTIVTSWEAQFSKRINQMLKQLDIPWTAQVAELAKVLTRLAND